MLRILHYAAHYGRVLLILGLLGGVLLPEFASLLRSWLEVILSILLFLVALRIGPKDALGSISDVPRFLMIALLFQVALPLVLIGVFWASGLLTTTLAFAVILVAAAPSISGSANISIMVGGEPAPALRLMVIGTIILPLTIIPVFYLVPDFGGVQSILDASAKLLIVIVLSGAMAFLFRYLVLPEPDVATIKAIDGASAITMAVLVIGLMSSVGLAISQAFSEFLWWLAIAFITSFGLQILSGFSLSGVISSQEVTPLSIVAGCRNSALFLVALPAEVIDPILLFIGCYQIPMYLTPFVLRKFYARFIP